MMHNYFRIYIKKTQNVKLTPDEEENTEGKGTPLSGAWGSLPGPELSRSRRLVPSVLGCVGPDPKRRLLNILGLGPDGLERLLKASRPKGVRESRAIMDRKELESKKTEGESLGSHKKSNPL